MSKMFAVCIWVGEEEDVQQNVKAQKKCFGKCIKVKEEELERFEELNPKAIEHMVERGRKFFKNMIK